MNVRHGEGHRLGSRASAIVAQSRAVVGPGGDAAVVRRRSTTVARDPAGEGCSLSAVTLIGLVSGHRADRGILVVRHRHREAG